MHTLNKRQFNEMLETFTPIDNIHPDCLDVAEILDEIDDKFGIDYIVVNDVGDDITAQVKREWSENEIKTHIAFLNE